MFDKRQRIQDKILGTIALMDPSGVNKHKYESMFVKMSDKQFTEWIERFYQMKIKIQN